MVLKKALWCVLGATVLGAVFLLYLKPEMVINFADLVWGCF